VVTGGHTYPSSFYTLFEEDWIDWRHAASQREAFSKPLLDRFDVILLHDMAEDLEPPLRANLRAFLEAGKGLVSTHHSIVDYTGWEWFWREATGGKYFTKPLDGHAASSFKEGLPMVVRPVRPHPITQGVGTIVTVDEAYRGMWFAPGITPLMETDRPENDKPVVYLGPSPTLRCVYIQLGHDEETHRHPSYRRLIHNALHWAAGR
jgi:type 1 glutamine amidotransferase